jgi:predicted TIM-barrel enzyme
MFASPRPVIAMVHVGALPGTPASRATLRELEERAVAECAVYREAGVHGVALENMHDVPYLRGGVGPEITAAATAELMRADAVIVTGTATGEIPGERDIAEVRGRCRVPLYLGSGVTAENLPRYFAGADGFIVGSA